MQKLFAEQKFFSFLFSCHELFWQSDKACGLFLRLKMYGIIKETRLY